MAKRKENRIVLKIIACALIFIIGVIGGFASVFIGSFIDKDESNVTVDELSIHVMELGNDKTGDSIYIKAGETDILVDAGSSSDSLDTIRNYVNQYCIDGVLEYVIVTHADTDHIACFAGSSKSAPSLFDYYKCKTIIDFPLTIKAVEGGKEETATGLRYVERRNKEVEEDGAVHYTALQCYNNQGGAKREYKLSSGITMEFLYNFYYENYTNDENDYSVCFMLKHGDKNFLFTGDLESAGEAKLVEHNDLPEVEFFKAGHHGSATSSSEVLLSKIKPKIIAISCCAGSVQYTQNLENTFPYQVVVERMSNYTDKVYVTSYATVEHNGTKYVNTGFGALNGNIVVTSKGSSVTVNCSNNNTLLKDTQWFKDNRTMPTSWLSQE